MPWSDGPAEANCHFQLYGQLSPAFISANGMQELENEMNEPTGIRLPSRPRLSMDTIALSKNCGIAIKANHLKGLK